MDTNHDNYTESGPDSPSSMVNDAKTCSSTSLSRKSKRGVHKRIVSVPIKDLEGTRMLKGESTPPPSDSWAWRKYGQKPIKGSPYPRGYYRCSSSKGCPARKQVERSRIDPTMLVVTYSSDHNHPWPPPSRTGHHHKHNSILKPETPPAAEQEPETEPEPEPEQEEEEGNKAKFTSLEEESLISDEFSWFRDMETTSSTILDNPIFAEGMRQSTTAAVVRDNNPDVGMFFPVREEDESLFADLGELPECSSVFRRHREVQIC